MHRLIIILLSIFAAALHGQSSLFDHLVATGDTAILHINTNWKKLARQKLDKEYQPMRISISVKNNTYAFPGKVKTRGNIRLQVCSNPSLKLKLNKDSLREAGFNSINDLKIVQQCNSSSVGLGYLRRERLVYELHAIYSQHHHRTVPIIIRREGQKDVNGFFVEEEEQLAARYGKVIESKHSSTRGMKRDAYVNLSLFNYLILNTDWQIFNRHNVELVTDTIGGRTIPIPYDFDYSGFVGTSYSVPREELDIASVYVPKWLGRHVSEEEITTAAVHFLSKAEAAEQLISNYPNLRAPDRRRMLKRLEEFNELLGKRKQLLKLVGR